MGALHLWHARALYHWHVRALHFWRARASSIDLRAREVVGVFMWQRPHRWLCHRGRSDITLAGSHCRDPPAITVLG